MTRYNKGANAERELLNALYEAGMAVCRVAGSGKNDKPMPDAVALKKGKIFAFECKAWKADNLNISRVQVEELEAWCQLAGAEFVIAWKIPHKGWRFFGKEHLHATGKAYAISREKAFAVGKNLDDFKLG